MRLVWAQVAQCGGKIQILKIGSNVSIKCFCSKTVCERLKTSLVEDKHIQIFNSYPHLIPYTNSSFNINPSYFLIRVALLLTLSMKNMFIKLKLSTKSTLESNRMAIQSYKVNYNINISGNLFRGSPVSQAA